MYDFEGCIKQWLHEDKVSQGLVALLLAIEDDNLMSLDTPSDAQEAEWVERNFAHWRASAKLTLENQETPS